jgi:putative lipoic acid-binding regulatory protein
MNNPTSPVNESLIEYPCDFPLKIFGKQHADFAQTILKIVHKHDPSFLAESMEMRSSKNARYISLTCTISATSREQLDAVYTELSGHPMVTMIL